MELSERLNDFPFSYASLTTNANFSRSDSHRLLQLSGVDNKGLWKYLFTTSGYGPGDGLKEWHGLIYELESNKSSQRIFDSDAAFLKAYVIREYAEALSIRDRLDTWKAESDGLFSVNLQNWSEYYNHLKIPNSSPFAFLFHWPLTVYHILKIFSEAGNTNSAALKKLIDISAASRILDKKSLKIHLLGVETELDLLPVFKNISVTMIGPNISPRVTNKSWLLCSRISVLAWHGVYHDFVEERKSHSSFNLPDIVIGLNVGFVAYSTWKRSLEIIKASNLPAFFTDSCPYSCMWNLEVLRTLGLCSKFDVNNPELSLSLININPFRSPLRIQVGGTCWSKFSNAFVFSTNSA
ncbi:hypothetical protein Aperf_G00000082843 [Anoplocephala perfoliata]